MNVRLFLLFGILMSGCAPVVTLGVPDTLQVSNKNDYRSLSECLFRSLAAERGDMDFSLFTCTRSAVLSNAEQPATHFVKITALPDGSLVDASADTESIDQIARHLERCEKQLNQDRAAVQLP